MKHLNPNLDNIINAEIAAAQDATSTIGSVGVITTAMGSDAVGDLVIATSGGNTDETPAVTQADGALVTISTFTDGTTASSNSATQTFTITDSSTPLAMVDDTVVFSDGIQVGTPGFGGSVLFGANGVTGTVTDVTGNEITISTSVAVTSTSGQISGGSVTISRAGDPVVTVAGDLTVNGITTLGITSTTAPSTGTSIGVTATGEVVTIAAAAGGAGAVNLTATDAIPEVPATGPQAPITTTFGAVVNDGVNGLILNGNNTFDRTAGNLNWNFLDSSGQNLGGPSGGNNSSGTIGNTGGFGTEIPIGTNATVTPSLELITWSASRPNSRSTTNGGSGLDTMPQDIIDFLNSLDLTETISNQTTNSSTNLLSTPFNMVWTAGDAGFGGPDVTIAISDIRIWYFEDAVNANNLPFTVVLFGGTDTAFQIGGAANPIFGTSRGQLGTSGLNQSLFTSPSFATGDFVSTTGVINSGEEGLGFAPSTGTGIGQVGIGYQISVTGPMLPGDAAIPAVPATTTVTGNLIVTGTGGTTAGITSSIGGGVIDYNSGTAFTFSTRNGFGFDNVVIMAEAGPGGAPWTIPDGTDFSSSSVLGMSASQLGAIAFSTNNQPNHTQFPAAVPADTFANALGASPALTPPFSLPNNTGTGNLITTPIPITVMEDASNFITVTVSHIELTGTGNFYVLFFGGTGTAQNLWGGDTYASIPTFQASDYVSGAGTFNIANSYTIASDTAVGTLTLGTGGILDLLIATTLTDAANDVAAAAAGVAVNEIYRSGSTLMIRVT